MTTVIKQSFHALTRPQQNKLLAEIYGFSPQIREFLDSRLLHAVDGEALIDAMQKETLDKVFHSPNPRVPDGRSVRSIIARARKLGASDETMMELERLAFEGFIEFLNEYGGGPDSFDDMACSHLASYLRLARRVYEDEISYMDCTENIRRYLRKKRNMITDYVLDTFETVTGLPI